MRRLFISCPMSLRLSKVRRWDFPVWPRIGLFFNVQALSPQNAFSYTARAEVWGPSPYSWRVHVERS